jgi:putative addiction module component (TIGR02574 family)
MDISLPLNKMTSLDKIAVMEQLWDDLCQNPESVPSPDWHRDVLVEREGLIKEGKAEFISIETVKNRIRNHLR